MNQVIPVLSILCAIAGNYVEAQRVAPGVPPQHYQQQPPQYQQQQYQQQIPQQQIPQHQQMHHQQQIPQQQIPQQQMHQQQVPVVQHQQPHQPQQIPQQQHQQAQGHHHAAPQPGQILNAANMQHEKEHMAEHFDVPMDTSKMSEQELQFHYFKMHDADNNNKLDGCELIKSLIHWHDPNDKDSTNKQVSLSDEEFVQVLDPLFLSMDENTDGFIDYTEYKKHTESGS